MSYKIQSLSPGMTAYVCAVACACSYNLVIEGKQMSCSMSTAGVWLEKLKYVAGVLYKGQKLLITEEQVLLRVKTTLIKSHALMKHITLFFFLTECFKLYCWFGIFAVGKSCFSLAFISMHFYLTPSNPFLGLCNSVVIVACLPTCVLTSS